MSRAVITRREAMLGWRIRLSLLAAVGSLLLSVAAPDAARAATQTPTPSPAPQRAPGVAASPSVARGVTPTPVETVSITPTATATATPIPSPTPTGTAQATSTPAPASVQQAPADANPAEIEAAVDWQAFVPTDEADHLAAMNRAARDSGCGVPWQLLAAIARVESDFGRNMATSTAGAIGYGQFLPTSWQAFGSDGNAYDYRDALPAIALYLCESGLARDPRTSLYAYNHADWYVDRVLSLAVRFDRMAPGAPTPDVLGVEPSEPPAMPMRYAAGRDLQLQGRPRTLDDGRVRWLAAPWRGRAPGRPISAEALATASLTMLRVAVTRSDRPLASASSVRLTDLANAAWDAGLLPLPLGPRATLADLKLELSRGRPVVVAVDGRALPGHPPDEDIGDQPLVLVGTTADGLIYSDPSFSSSLGYGLELSDADFLNAWGTEAGGRQALAFMARPKQVAVQSHVRVAEQPEDIARVLPTFTSVPPTSVEVPTQVVVAPTAEVVAAAAVPEEVGGSDYSWLVVAGAAILVFAAVVLWRFRAVASAREDS